MANRKTAKIALQGDSIELQLPLASQGKFRCKKRSTCREFGSGFAPSTGTMTEDAYLEWQIGYDAIVGSDKETSLDNENYVFIGANGKKKFPYELSEILHCMCESGILAKADLEETRNRIEGEAEYLQDEYKIQLEAVGSAVKNGVPFFESYTRLPTFVFEDKATLLQIEIVIAKQQYGTGIQPMVYLNIPMGAFANRDEIIGRTAKKVPFGKLLLTGEHKNLILTLLVCFGMCSKSHKHDIMEIIKVIWKNVFETPC